MKIFRVLLTAACPFPLSRGTPARIYRMAEALAARGHDVHVATYHLGEAFRSKPPFTVHRIRDVAAYRKTSPGPALRKILQLDPMLAATVAEVARGQRIEVIHAHHLEGLAVSWPTARWRHIPLIYDAHTTLGSELHYYELGLPDRAKRLAGRLIDRWAPGLADHVVAVSEEIRRDIVGRSRVPAERVSVMPNGVEAEHFATEAPEVPVSGPGTIIYAGNLAPYQGIDLLIHSFRRVLDRRPGTRLILATEDGFEDYEGAARELGVRENIDVLHTGFQDLPARLAMSAIAVNPRSEGAGLPQKLLNYMAAGRPVVSFEGSARLMVHGRHGTIVPNGDVGAFANAVVDLLDDRQAARALGENGRDLVRKHHSWDQLAERLEELYGRLIPDAPRLARALPAPPPAVCAPADPATTTQVTSIPAAVVVNYNGGERIARTVRSLLALTHPPARIVVVDNASTDGSPARLRAEFPGVEILAMPVNAGLPAARNAGLRHVPSGPVLLLDGDVYPAGDAVERMQAALEEFGAAVACPRVLLYPELEVIQCDGASVHFIGTMGLRHADLPLDGRTAMEMHPRTVEVGACIGACMVVDRDKVLSAGGFDERYFFYFEDLEFSLRMRALGHRLVCVPEAVVHHDRGRGTPGLSFRGEGSYPLRRAELTMRHRLLTIFTHFSARTILVLSPVLALYELASLALVLRNGWGRAWAAAWVWQFRNAGEIRRQRRAMQQRRRRRDRDLLEGGPLPLARGVLGSRPAAAVAALSFLLNGYWRLVRRMIG